MLPDEKWQRTRKDYQLVRDQFVLTELDLAITFAERALLSRNTDTTQRNILLAQEAYSVANRFLSQASLTWKMKQDLQGRIAKLHRISRQFLLAGLRLF